MKIGFIGCGNMASAMIGGIIKNQVTAPADILASAKTAASREKKKEELGIALTADNREVAAFADVLILAVKPFYYEEVIKEIRDVVSEDTIVVSIAPGKKLAWMEGLFEKPLKIVRTMPNTPALVGEGMSCVCGNEKCSSEDVDTVCRIFAGFGKTEIVEEDMIDVVVGVSGSSPAYVFMFIEAMADAAVADGMPRQFLEVRRWFLRPANIRENSKTWSALRKERRSKPSGCWRRKDCEARYLKR